VTATEPVLTKAQIREQRIEEEREYYLSDEGFLDFVRDCGAAPDAQWEPHGRGAQFILNWEGTPDPENLEVILYKNKMVLWPRGTFKSQVFTVGLACWEIAKNPNIRGFIGSETGRQSRKFLKNVMLIIESPWFEERFGVHKDPKAWSYISGFVSAQRTMTHLKDPTLAAFGEGEVQTGAHWDMGWLDDPISQENTKTPEAIENVKTWIGELMAQLDPGSRLLACGTIHHFADFWCKTIKDPEAKKDWQISRHEWIDSEGTLFFPGRLTRAFVESRKRNMPSRQFYAYYHNKPMSEEEQIFLPEYFRVIPDQDIPRACWTYIMTDFAFSALEQNDRTAFWVVSLDTHRYAYVHDVLVDRWKPAESTQRLAALWDQWCHWEPKAVAIEKTTHKELIAGYLEELRRKTFIRPRIVEVGGRSNEIKMTRIHGIEPRFREGRIYFAQSLRDQMRKWKPMFEEMTEWPFSANDDVPDAISDIDQRDERGRWLFPGPPASWTPYVAMTQPPSLVDGKYNPNARYDARDMIKNLQPRAGTDPLWQNNASPGQQGQQDLYRKRGSQPSLWKRS
jgi:predicted phage terminase large subunit-like protein